MKRVLRVYAEVFDEDTGLVSVASLGDGEVWPPPLAEVRSELGVREPAGQEVAAVGVGREEPPAESGEEPRVPPTYMAELIEPEGEPAVSDEALPEFDVVDDPAALALVWDDGVTEKNRRMHMAPFADGMWLVFENGGEFLVFLQRGRLKPTEFETQSSLKEAKALASMLSKRWMLETQGDPFLQGLADKNAGDFVRWVGPMLDVDSIHYHFRAGQVRRQQTTTLLNYRAHKSEDEGRERIQVRITPTKTGRTLAVWALHFSADGKIAGSFFEADLPRERLAELRDLQFGPAPGKRLRWMAISRWEEQAEWGRHVLVLQRGRGLSGLALRKRGGDVFLACGDPEELKRSALNELVRHLRTRSRKAPSPSKAPDKPSETPETSPEPPEPESGQEVEPAPEPAPEITSKPASDSTTPARPEPGERPLPAELNLSQAMQEAFIALASATPGTDEHSRVWERTNKKSAAALESRGLIDGDGGLTPLGRWALGLPPAEGDPPLGLSPAMLESLVVLRGIEPGSAEHAKVLERLEQAPLEGLEEQGLLTADQGLTPLGRLVVGLPSASDEEEYADVDARDDGGADEELVSADEGRAIDEAIGGAVTEITSRLPPLPPE